LSRQSRGLCPGKAENVGKNSLSLKYFILLLFFPFLPIRCIEKTKRRLKKERFLLFFYLNVFLRKAMAWTSTRMLQATLSSGRANEFSLIFSRQQKQTKEEKKFQTFKQF
jgi:hypothetical protein